MRLERHPHLELERLFPIKDEPSARLMAYKAECLHRAGVITRRERQTIQSRAAGARCRAAA